MTKNYSAMVSSDWNGCLAPCGPFDFISFAYPHLEANLAAVFRQYTGNLISLGEAAAQIRELLPKPITPNQIDDYLDESFTTYTGVPELIEWCASNSILFMINTTGMIGYFQQIFANNFLPPVPVVSAHEPSLKTFSTSICWLSGAWVPMAIRNSSSSPGSFTP